MATWPSSILCPITSSNYYTQTEEARFILSGSLKSLHIAMFRVSRTAGHAYILEFLAICHYKVSFTELTVDTSVLLLLLLLLLWLLVCEVAPCLDWYGSPGGRSLVTSRAITRQADPGSSTLTQRAPPGPEEATMPPRRWPRLNP